MSVEPEKVCEIAATYQNRHGSVIPISIEGYPVAVA